MAAVRVSEVANTRPYMAWVTPMSRTRPAAERNGPSGSSGRPKSLTSSAPATLKRSVIVVEVTALSW